MSGPVQSKLDREILCSCRMDRAHTGLESHKEFLAWIKFHTVGQMRGCRLRKHRPQQQHLAASHLLAFFSFLFISLVSTRCGSRWHTKRQQLARKVGFSSMCSPLMTVRNGVTLTRAVPFPAPRTLIEMTRANSREAALLPSMIWEARCASQPPKRAAAPCCQVKGFSRWGLRSSQLRSGRCGLRGGRVWCGGSERRFGSRGETDLGAQAPFF